MTRDGRVSGLGKIVTFFLSTLTDEKGATKQHSHLDSTPHTLPVRQRDGRISHFSSAGGRDRVSGRLCINPDALRGKRFAANREKILATMKDAESEGKQGLVTIRRTPLLSPLPEAERGSRRKAGSVSPLFPERFLAPDFLPLSASGRGLGGGVSVAAAITGGCCSALHGDRILASPASGVRAAYRFAVPAGELPRIPRSAPARSPG